MTEHTFNPQLRAARFLPRTILHVVPGAYHNFDSIEAGAAISQPFLQARTAALDEALNGG